MIKAAYIVAFLLAAMGLIGTAFTGPVIFAPVALIPLISGIGIVRRHAWSAYGLALFVGAQLLLIPLILTRSGSLSGLPTLAFNVVLCLALVTLFFSAGRALARESVSRGLPIFWIIVSALAVLPFIFFQAFVNPTGSMENTLEVGDRMFVRVLPRPRFHVGEMAVFRYPVDRTQIFIKRIIGVPGDRIRIAHKVVMRNGVWITEEYAVHKVKNEDQYRDNFPGEPAFGVATEGLEMLRSHVVNGEVIVPAGKYFLLGDNRDQSLDSRYWGFVDSTDFIGKPAMIYDSAVQRTDTYGASASKLRRWGDTRWDRLFKILR